MVSTMTRPVRLAHSNRPRSAARTGAGQGHRARSDEGASLGAIELGVTRARPFAPSIAMQLLTGALVMEPLCQQRRPRRPDCWETPDLAAQRRSDSVAKVLDRSDAPAGESAHPRLRAGRGDL